MLWQKLPFKHQILLFSDFAVGAPFADGGGSVFIYSGARTPEEFNRDAEQVFISDCFVPSTV